MAAGRESVTADSTVENGAEAEKESHGSKSMKSSDVHSSHGNESPIESCPSGTARHLSKRSDLTLPLDSIKEKTPGQRMSPESCLEQKLSSPEPQAVSLQFLKDMTIGPPRTPTLPVTDSRIERRRHKARERERGRVKKMKRAFERLQRSMRFIPPETVLSKIKALKFAIQYIRFLTDLNKETNLTALSERNAFLHRNFANFIASTPSASSADEDPDYNQEVSDSSSAEDESPCDSDSPDMWKSAMDDVEKLFGDGAAQEGALLTLIGEDNVHL